MAPPSPQSPQHSNGSDAFNADGRATARENRPITIGGEEFKPRRKTAKVMREFRALLREDTKLQIETRQLPKADEGALAGIEARIETLDPADREGRDALEAEKAALPVADQDKLADLEERREDLLYELIQALLAPGDDPKGEVTIDFLQEHLDSEDAEELADFLTPGSTPDPTPAATTTEPTSS